MMKSGAIVVAAAVCGFCSVANAKDSSYAPSFSCVGGPLGLDVPPTYSALRELGPIQGEKTIKSDSPGVGEASRRGIWFSGLVLDLYTFAHQPQRYLIASATIKDKRWRIAGPLRVGQTVDEARERLAAFGVTLDPTLSFGGDGGKITLKLSANVISEIDYSCYTG